MVEKHLDSWGPFSITNGYLRWSLPAHCWSGEEFGEETVEVYYTYHTDEWHACTEAGQCVKRDLDTPEVEQLRKEFGLDRYVEEYRPAQVPGL